MRGMMRNSIFDGMTYLERQEYRAKRKVELAAIKAKKTAIAKHCQCCGRAIFAETGTIAHHGYERPGYGYQTASCMGAKYPPFEVSRDRLGDLIVALKDMKSRQIAARAEAAAEKFPVSRTYTNHHAPRVVKPGGHHRGDYPTVELAFTRENFVALVEENTGPHGSEKLWDTYYANRMLEAGFDKIKAEDLAERDGQIKMTREHLAECTKRYAGWKRTHEWNDGWIKLETEG